MNRSSKISRKVGVFAVLTATVFISGCTQSIARRDSISTSFGNAMASNTALQTVDPWPRNVENTHIHTDGAKSINAIDAYRTPVAPDNAESTPIAQTVTAPNTSN